MLLMLIIISILFRYGHPYIVPWNRLQSYNIGELQSAVGDMKQHLMFVHAVSGCDTVSVPDIKGQKRALEVLYLAMVTMTL